ncbi:serine hydrolase domain-containing protein [Sandarakinorhabdus sp. AAP62]|uniref:serine hydrolase domain-containing protein n=1 Tax=Sandarakinorhabdus sp. AAP62 TaxID=1248916 RepID=UPI00187C030A|nr:serine hydrolase domain-containing protein [Sandarakinorhabdus sp. AAP62]
MTFAAPAQDQGREINAVFASYQPGAPGCAVGVQQAGKVLFAKGYGSADIKAGLAFTPQSKVYMASVSKQVAAMAILLLVEDGRVRLNDPVRKLIPELPAYAEGVTLAQMLNHTSGIRDYFTLGGLNGFDNDHVYTEAGVLDLLRQQQALNFTPGSEFLYSNSGYVLAAMIVQRVSGQRLDDFARARIFTPLQMAGSKFQHDHNALILDKANGYERRDGGWIASNSNLDVTGDGGLYSSVDDMLRWLANLDAPIIGTQALSTMRASALLNDGSPSGYGMGLETSRFRGLELVDHGGALAGYRTADWWFPEKKLGVVVLCNHADARPSELAARVASVFVPIITKSSDWLNSSATSGDLDRYAGVYRDAKGGYAEFARRGSELLALRPDRPLAATAAGSFVVATDADGQRFDFRPDRALDVVRAGRPTRHLERVDPVSLSADVMAGYVGDYLSPEVATPVHIELRGTGPFYSFKGSPASPLVATGADRLWDPARGFELGILRGADGGVVGFTLNAGRARGIRYMRSAS